MKECLKCREGCWLLPGTDRFEIGLSDCPLSLPQNHSAKRGNNFSQEVKMKFNLFLLFLAFYKLFRTLIMFFEHIFDYFSILSRNMGVTCVSCATTGP